MDSRRRSKKKKKEGQTLTLADVISLGEQLLSSRAHINNLPRLLSFLSPSSPPDFILESLLSLQSFFVTLLPDIQSSSSSRSQSLSDSGALAGENKDPELVYRAWLRSKFDEFVDKLIEIAVSSQSAEATRDVVLDALMEFVKLGKKGKFQSAIYHRFLHGIVHATSSVLLDLLVQNFIKYVDVRYFTYVSLDKIARSFEQKDLNGSREVSQRDDDDSCVTESGTRMDDAVHAIYSILSHIPPLEVLAEKSDYEMWSQLGFQFKETGKKRSSEILLDDNKPQKSKTTIHEISVSHIRKKVKAKFTKAWISFLRLPLPIDVYKEVLVSLHQIVVPHIANPVILSDFLTRSYDIGGVISIMALSSLYILMTQHGLEYPNFYEKLYALLTPAIFMAKHRARFFQLLDSSLKSSHIPAYLAAAFAKKLSRLALSVPPSGSLVIIAIIHNLLRRHPSINFLVHQLVGDENNEDTSSRSTESLEHGRESDAGLVVQRRKDGVDPFNSEEIDPVKSNAMRSSLWEIDTLRHHYCPAVSRFVVSLENDLTVRAKTSEVTVSDFSSGSYATIFKEEVRRRIKQVPLAFYKVTPTSLFSGSDFTGWSFGNEALGSKLENENVESGEEQEFRKRQRVECI